MVSAVKIPGEYYQMFVPESKTGRFIVQVYGKKSGAVFLEIQYQRIR
jgi:hypothetical protein